MITDVRMLIGVICCVCSFFFLFVFFDDYDLS